MQHGTFRSALARSAFRRALIAYAFGSAAVGIASVVVSVTLFERGGSPAWATVGAVSRVAPYVVLSGISGAIADRRDHRRVLIASYVAQIFAAAALVVSAQAAPLVVVAGVGLLGNALWTFAYPTMAALVPRMVGAEDLAPANGLLSAIVSIAWIVGPGIGGLLITSAGAQWAAAAAVAFASVGAATMLTVRARDVGTLHVPAGDHESLRSAFATGIRTIVQSSAVLVPLLLLLVTEVVYGATEVLLLVAATDHLDMSEGGYGALNAALGVGALLSLLVINRAARSRRATATLVASVLAASMPLAIVGVVAVPVAAIVLLVVTGLGMVVTEVLALTAMQRVVPMTQLARVFGILDSLIVGAILFGAAVAGPLIALAGIGWALVIVGAVVPIAAVIATPRLVRSRATTAAELSELAPTISLLQGLSFFRYASPNAIEAIAALAVREPVPAGTVLVRQGDEPDDFFAIESGDLGVHITHATGVTEHVRTMGPGQGFGELGLLNGTPRTATVSAATDSVVLRVPGAAFLHAVGPGAATGAVGPGAGILDYVMAH
jgi:MFS family permease